MTGKGVHCALPKKRESNATQTTRGDEDDKER